ncbi:conserved hypothetical protein [methanotrophic bacterial endosymbiont of Bathymodiolus sp.]|nr:conserved hypothetical protein [methanotrophic bacterial endosymbiont of Bathymodiolus sp.]
MGVFPDRLPLMILSTTLPHARGGVSESILAIINHVKSSPRPWGCFQSQRRCC